MVYNKRYRNLDRNGEDSIFCLTFTVHIIFDENDSLNILLLLKFQN